ncbi:MAG: hypothetical protein E7382_05985 [Clostridiales bacterium]|nr:hypothetical protein [Clostridiales bacterium]
MEILQTLISLLSNGINGNANSPVTDFLKNVDLSQLAPLINGLFSRQEKSPTDSVGHGEHLNPIANIADKDIVYTLNKYYSDGGS